MESFSAVVPASDILNLRNDAPLPPLLSLTPQMETSELRDRVYALLSLYSMWLSWKGSSRPSVNPNYRKTVIGVYGVQSLCTAVGAQRGLYHHDRHAAQTQKCLF